jgi:hypothetical protein
MRASPYPDLGYRYQCQLDALLIRRKYRLVTGLFF